MKTSVLFGNGFNRAIDSGISWDDLLKTLMRKRSFDYRDLPNTMTYERILLERPSKNEELEIKREIANNLAQTSGNCLYEELVAIGCENYLTTNYDYAFEQSIALQGNPRATEEVYSLRRYREYPEGKENIRLWSIHGEVAHPKSIMLGLDHYCGTIAKLDSYIKGTYSTQRDGKPYSVSRMEEKINSGIYCHTSWVDLFFSSDVHSVGLSLDYSETDLWWVLNKRARLAQSTPVRNKIYFHSTSESASKLELLRSFGVNIISHAVNPGGYLPAYKNALAKIQEEKNRRARIGK